MIWLKVEQEYERLKKLFDSVDEKQLSLIDGALWECARLKIELDDLNKIVKESGLLKVSSTNKSLQKELPVSKMIVKVRANYLNYIAKLANILGKTIDDDDNDLEDFE